MTATPRCPRDHRGWDHPIPMDRIPPQYGGGWGCPGVLVDGSDCGYELGADEQPRPRDIPAAELLAGLRARMTALAGELDEAGAILRSDAAKRIREALVTP